MDPTDWYETMLPHTMMKLDQATIGGKTKQGSDYGQRFINRRQDSYSRYKDNDLIRGAKVLPTVEDQYTQDAPNGRYFYIDDIIAFDETTQMKVFNDRIRMDFSTIFPQVMTENIRLNGDPAKDDNSAKADQTFANGKNYWFPAGYLDHVTMRGGYLVYRRPHRNFWSYEGDEWNLFGDYDISFRLPPVPYEGEYQIRLGFCALKTRGVAQVYFDNRPQGIPLDMRKFLDDASILGSKFTTDWAKLSSEEKAEDQEDLAQPRTLSWRLRWLPHRRQRDQRVCQQSTYPPHRALHRTHRSQVRPLPAHPLYVDQQTRQQQRVHARLPGDCAKEHLLRGCRTDGDRPLTTDAARPAHVLACSDTAGRQSNRYFRRINDYEKNI